MMKSNIRNHNLLKLPSLVLARIIMNEQVGRLLSDKCFIQLSYRLKQGKKLYLNDPKTFNEKIQWLKLNYNNKEIFTKMVDKYEVRKIVEEKIGKDYLIPCLGLWHNAEEIDFDSLPDQFVLKCTHDSGSVFICKEKNRLNKGEVIAKLNGALKHNFFWKGREYPYKDVTPRIIAEPFMEDLETKDLPDYKFFCFNGEPKILFFASERFNCKSLPKFDFYDMDLNWLDISRPGHGHAVTPLSNFPEFDEMKQIVKKLSEGFPFIRIDLYLINHKVYFGEFTFHPSGGYEPFVPDKWDRILGDWIQLPKAPQTTYL